MLQDAIWADGERLESDDGVPRHRRPVRRRVAAGLGVLPRQRPRRAATSCVAQGSKLGASHQLWQMNEINKLIWPAADGVGVIDQAAWDRTVEIAQSTPNLEGTTVLTAPPDAGAYTNDIVTEALANLQELGRRHDRRFVPADRGHAERGRRLDRTGWQAGPSWPACPHLSSGRWRPCSC